PADRWRDRGPDRAPPCRPARGGPALHNARSWLAAPSPIRADAPCAGRRLRRRDYTCRISVAGDRGAEGRIPILRPGASGAEPPEVVVHVDWLELHQQAGVGRVAHHDPAATALIEAAHRHLVGARGG